MFELKNISKTYDRVRGSAVPGPGMPVLKNFSLSVKKGEVFGLIGLSGAGKSTALRIFNLLETPQSGQVLFDNKEISAENPSELRKTRQKIGMIFQQFNLLSNKTVAENVALPLKIAGWKKELIKARVEECLELVGLLDKIHAYPHQLSGGQKQRVAIARSIANNPDLLLADEPTSALDPITKRDVLNCLLDINSKLGLTIVITTHEMNVIRQICQRVAILHEGVVQEILDVNERKVAPETSIGKLLLEIT